MTTDISSRGQACEPDDIGSADRPSARRERMADVLLFPPRTPKPPPSVLIVNQDPRQAAAVARMLDMVGYASEVAHDISDAGLAIARRQWHSVLWDIDAPGLDRRDAFIRLRRLLDDAPRASS